MTGKVPNLRQAMGGLRLKGVVRVFWSEKYQRYVARAWQPKTPVKSWRRQASIDAFTATVKLIKNTSGEDQIAAEEMAANTPFLARDLKMKAARGVLYEWRMADGTVWVGRGQVYPDIQAALNSISQDVGTILVRTSEGWQALLPGNDLDVLTMDGPTGLPLWRAPTSGGGGGGGGFTVMPFSNVASSLVHACAGNLLLPHNNLGITEVCAQWTSVSGESYDIGICEVNASTKAITAAPVYTGAFTAPSSAANTVVALNFGTEQVLLGGHAYIIFLRRRTGGNTPSQQYCGITGNTFGPGLYMPSATTAWKLAKAAPAIGDTWVTGGSGAWAVGFTATVK